MRDFCKLQKLCYKNEDAHDDTSKQEQLHVGGRANRSKSAVDIHCRYSICWQLHNKKMLDLENVRQRVGAQHPQCNSMENIKIYKRHYTFFALDFVISEILALRILYLQMYVNIMDITTCAITPFDGKYQPI